MRTKFKRVSFAGGSGGPANNGLRPFGPSAIIKLTVNLMMRSAMIDLEEIRSLSDFQRNAKQHIVRMKKKRRPLVLTINGKAEMVAVDVKSFQEMLEIIDRVEAVEGIRRGLESKKRGEGKTLEQFDREMRKKYKVSETLQNDL